MKFKCLKCGHIEEVDYNLVGLFDSPVHTLCSKCNSLCEEYISEETEEINDLVNDDLLNDKDWQIECVKCMRAYIDEQGDTEIWNEIEHLADPETRALQRGYFIKAGGKIPEGEAITI
jgi:transcription elongation factor Elf1